MSEPRKNHLTIDGGQVKEDENNTATYKPIPDADSDFKSKPTLSKSKEKISDEAEEKLLEKEEEAKIVTRVDMADAKYVVGDHRNGDAKIELDANKRQFSGLTKEELLKYADDPFWVRLRWFMFVLFWALWLCMLAGAVAIIVRAPKCAPPPPKTWFEKGPLLQNSLASSLNEDDFQLLQESGVQAVFAEAGSAYEELSQPDGLEKLKQFVEKAKKYSVKVIVELTPNFVSTTHEWFNKSVNRTAPYDSYFTWAKGKEYGETGPNPPNNWVSTLNESAWTWHEERGEFYLHQFAADQADLNFHQPSVVQEFDNVLKAVMKAGAHGVRLHKVRQVLVNQSLPDDVPVPPTGGALGADHMSYGFYQHRYTSDQPQLDGLLARWSKVVDDNAETPGAGESVFTVSEEGERAEHVVARNLSVLRPRSAARVLLRPRHVPAAVAAVTSRLAAWPAVQLKLEPSDPAAEAELASFAMLLPAAPVYHLGQLRPVEENATDSEKLSHLVPLRDDASIKHGRSALAAVDATDSDQLLIACARWKHGHTGYVGVFNPGPAAARANLTLPSLPPVLTVHHVSRQVYLLTNYTSNLAVKKDDVLVPARSTVVLSYVPKEAEEQ